MSLLSKVPKDLIIEIIKKTKKTYYRLTYGIMRQYVCGNIGNMYEIIRNSHKIQREISGFWLWNYEKFFDGDKDAKNLGNKLIELRQKDYDEETYKYVVEILEKYPIPDAKIEKVSIYGDPDVYKMSKNKLIKYLYRIPSMKCYWLYFAIHSEEYYFYLENKMDLVQKIDKTIIGNLLKEVKKLYKDGNRYIFDDFSKKVRMSEHINPELHRGEKIIQFNNLERFINTRLPQIIRYILSPDNKYVFGFMEIP